MKITEVSLDGDSLQDNNCVICCIDDYKEAIMARPPYTSDVGAVGASSLLKSLQHKADYSCTPTHYCALYSPVCTTIS